MKTALVFFIVSLLLLVACSGLAQQSDYSNTGASLQEDCKPPHGSFDQSQIVELAHNQGYCDGFVEGVVRTGVLLSVICLPDGVTFGQAQKILIKYLNNHPEKLHENKTLLTLNAFRTAWPCTGEVPTPRKKP